MSLIHEAESIGRIGRMEGLSAAVTYASDKYAGSSGKLYGLLVVTSAMAREYIAALGMVDATRAVTSQPPWVTRYGSDDDREARRHYANVMSYVIELHIRGNRAMGLTESALDFSCAEHREPTIPIRSYIERIMRYAPATKELYIVALALIDRALALNPGLVLTGRNAHRLVVTSLVVASKMFDDFFYTNKYLAVVAGVSTEELNQLELRLLSRLGFAVFVDVTLFAEYRRLFEQVVSFARSNEDLPAFFDTVYPPYRAQIISQSGYRRSAGRVASMTSSASPYTSKLFMDDVINDGGTLKSSDSYLVFNKGNKSGNSPMTSSLSSSPKSVAMTLRSSRSSVSSVSALSLHSQYQCNGSRSGGCGTGSRVSDVIDDVIGYDDGYEEDEDEDEEEEDDEDEEECRRILLGKGGKSNSCGVLKGMGVNNDKSGKNNKSRICDSHSIVKSESMKSIYGNNNTVKRANGVKGVKGNNNNNVYNVSKGGKGDVIRNSGVCAKRNTFNDVVEEEIGDSGICMDAPY